MDAKAAAAVLASLPKPVRCRGAHHGGAIQASCEAILEPGARFVHGQISARLIAGWRDDFGPMARDNPAQCSLTLRADGRVHPTIFAAWAEFLTSYSIQHTAGRPIGTADVLEISKPAEFRRIESGVQLG
jgi:hypothetical protein